MKHASYLVLPLALLAGTAFAGVSPAGATDHASNRAAHPAASQPADAFDALDKNHDGTLSRAEMSGHPKASHMAMVDENRDGVLSRDEYAELGNM